jgi:hypothetical protein
VAQDRDALDEAETWYRSSLTTFEQLGSRLEIAGVQHNLGIVAALRDELDEAEAWCRKSLSVVEQLGNRPSMAKTYSLLGLLYEVRGDFSAALEWVARCVTLFADFPHSLTGAGPTQLVRLTATLGLPALEAAWRRATDQSLPSHVRAWVEARMAEREAGSS